MQIQASPFILPLLRFTVSPLKQKAEWVLIAHQYRHPKLFDA